MHTITSALTLRRVILITLLVVPQQFWFRHAWRLSSRLSFKWKIASRIFIAFFAVTVVATLSDRLISPFIPRSIPPWIVSISYLWLFTSIFAFFCIKAVHTIEWIWGIIKRLCAPLFAKRRVGEKSVDLPEIGRRTVPEGMARENELPNPSRRSFFRYASAFVGTMPFLAGFYGYARERLNFQVVRVDVPIPNLPPTLNGFRIVQLSDVHAGDYMPPDEIRRAVNMANALSPHLAVVTGDIVSGAGDPLAECVAELSRFRAPLGIWGCNGNHEIYAGAEDTAEQLFAAHGMKMLRSASTQLNWNGQNINLIGIDYQRQLELTDARKPGLDGVESLVRRDMPNILLSHNPNSFYRAAELGIELTISGHTHGGQISLEIVSHNVSPARFMTQFIAGLYGAPFKPASGLSGPDNTKFAERKCHLYVNRGLGTLGIPARLGARPEITLLTLRPA